MCPELPVPPAPCCARHQDTLTEAKEHPEASAQEDLAAAILVRPAPEEPAARAGQDRDHHSLQGWVGREVSALPAPTAHGQPWLGEEWERSSLVLGGFCLLRVSIPTKGSSPEATGSRAPKAGMFSWN